MGKRRILLPREMDKEFEGLKKGRKEKNDCSVCGLVRGILFNYLWYLVKYMRQAKFFFGLFENITLPNKNLSYLINSSNDEKK
ncbi:unnamed protein product [Meloidogyne enterolobii]|uniref:Uncharacterized protein n=1 Tax=Meloidogyne enterolobii TaxID=390850 RepID=A0ACB1AD01_MELEN